jgi:ribosomal protein S18 acetylase RimI-like enzyme
LTPDNPADPDLPTPDRAGAGLPGTGLPGPVPAGTGLAVTDDRGGISAAGTKPAGDDLIKLDSIGAELIGLAERCLRADGGMPRAVEPWFLRRRWAAPEGTTFALRLPPGVALPPGHEPLAVGGTQSADEGLFAGEGLSVGEGLSADGPPAGSRSTAETPSAGRLLSAGGARGGGVLVAAGAVCPVGEKVVVTGLVDPLVRGLGIGGRVLDHALSLAGGADVTVETESLTGAAADLFGSRGFAQVFAEDVMRIGVSDSLPRAVWPGGIELVAWSGETAERFYQVYAASFRERPGFPGDPAEEWIADYDDDDDFRAGWSVLAFDRDGDLGFVTASAGWIEQVGVVPRSRGRGIGAALVRETLGRMRADGATEAWLTVNVDNPGAAGLYRRLGFGRRGRRARFQRVGRQE